MPDLDITPPSAPVGAMGGKPLAAPPMGGVGQPPTPPAVPPSSPTSSSSINQPARNAPATIGQVEAGAGGYSDIFDKPKGSPIKTLVMALVVLVVLLGIAGAVNKFVFDFGLGGLVPFLVKESSAPASETTSTETATTENPEIAAAKERDLKRKADLALIQSALTAYQTKNGAYPPTTGRIKLNEAGNALETALVGTFLQAMPKDPQDPQFSYQYQSDGQTYKLSAIIEDSADPQAINGGTFFYYELTPENSTAAAPTTSTTPSQ